MKPKCKVCGKETDMPLHTCDRSKNQNWRIEYEIPPLRAIYHAVAEFCTEAEAREMVRKEQPGWRIRKITVYSEP
jgi:hypothetical protein